MRVRYVVLAAIAFLVALGCFRLSAWQLDRREQRRDRNALLASRMHAAPVPLTEVPGDTAAAYRPVTLQGTFDFTSEFALALRSRSGSPGVYVITPLRLEDGRVALVNRGWIYAPDGMSAELSEWREPEHVRGQGYLEPFAPALGPVTLPGRSGIVRRLVRDSLTALAGNGMALFPWVVVLTQPASDSAPARIAPPEPGEGSHLSYAIQWGAFGIIALAGMILAIRRGMADRGTGEVAPPTAAG